MKSLHAHLFPGDHDEHGAVIAAGIARTGSGTRLLARELFLAEDGVDYVPGRRGYRMLTADFVTDKILRCTSQGLVYLAVHCHGGWDEVGFSDPDLASHERGYPALLDIANGAPVGALVFAEHAVAGDIWLPGGTRVELVDLRVVGRPNSTWYPAPPAQRSKTAPEYDRQARIFGDRGQDLLARQKVGVIGAGGAGSLLVEYLARLGVGHLVIVDPDRIEPSNLSRVVGATRFDARWWLTAPGRSRHLQHLGQRFAARKITIAKRVVQAANPKIVVEVVNGDLADDEVAQRLVDCDFLFLAADSVRARLVFNALVHQYLIPGTQVGAKVTVDPTSGEITDVFSVFRPVIPDSGCLWCNGLISPSRLQEEAISEKERQQQHYVEDTEVHAPSVITLNAVAAAHAADDFLFSVTELLDPKVGSDYRYFRPVAGSILYDEPAKDPQCPECGAGRKSRLALGDAKRLPTRIATNS
jgi:tRNA A37 threonylcarbamoyladenosine dehydratase